jgi:hypothetical protein
MQFQQIFADDLNYKFTALNLSCEDLILDEKTNSKSISLESLLNTLFDFSNREGYQPFHRNSTDLLSRLA